MVAQSWKMKKFFGFGRREVYSIQNLNAKRIMNEKAMFGAGCFWGVEAAFRKLKGVTSAAVGYSGGRTQNPTYEQVCSHQTGHAEVVLVEFDPGQISFAQLLETFWEIHNPTTLNRQGPDVGDQYRSAIFYFTSSQRDAALVSKESAQAKFSRPIVTEITPAAEFFRAEEYHQRYLEKKGLASCGVPGAKH